MIKICSALYFILISFQHRFSLPSAAVWIREAQRVSRHSTLRILIKDIKMNKQNETKLFAFKLANKTQEVKPATQWKTRDGVATAGCSGPDARGDHRWYGRDQGIWC
jgi:hypothetical protein